MRFQTDKKSLLSLLSKVLSVVEKQHIISILSNLRFDLQGDNLEISATDMDIHIVASMNVIGNVDGSLAIAAHTLFDIIKRLPDNNDIMFEQKNNSVVIDTQNTKCSLACFPSNEFPTFSNKSDNTYDECVFYLNSKIVSEILKGIKYAISIEAVRYYLNGVFINFSQDQSMLHFTATDGHRLASIQTKYSLHSGSNIEGAIIPHKTIGELIKILDSIDEEILFRISGNRIIVETEKIKILSKLIDGKFPNYEQSIPRHNKKIIEINNKKLKDAIFLVSTVSTDKAKTVNFQINKNQMKLSSASMANGGASAEQDLELEYSNITESMEISFNSKYVLDTLSAMNAKDSIRILFNSKETAVLIQEVKSNLATHLVMPIVSNNN
ncbi:MAG: DNA polymerase III subunit beta [Proteobacteria bacterium]|nr:DNA polymerase III subunit beta [Pseudomonadota bacterium]